ncbi:MAG: HNH endonuclease signature motif containing protein [Candidatus Nanopelagicales bacterium]
MDTDHDQRSRAKPGTTMIDLRERPAGAELPGEDIPRGQDRLGDVSTGVAGLLSAVRVLVSEGVLPVGLDTEDRPTADARALLGAVAQVEAVLGMRMAAAEAGGCLPLLSAGGMARHVYWSRGRARSLSRAGHLARSRTDLAQAWLGGTITAEHVDAAAKGVTGLPHDKAEAVLDGLTPLWGQVTPTTVATYCARARAIVDPPPEDPDAAASKAHEARFLSFTVLDDTVHITGSLARLDGELLMNTIHTTAGWMRVAGDGLTTGQRRADALTHLAATAATRTGPSTGPSAQPGTETTPGTAANPSAGAGAGVGVGVRAGVGVGVGAGAGAGVGAGAAIAITLTTDLDAVTGGGFHLTPADLRFTLCDPHLTPVLTERNGTSPPPPDGQPAHDTDRRPPDIPAAGGSSGIDRRRLAELTANALNAPRPLAVGRTQRVATPAQRRALAVRDGGCILPGCDIPATHCQIHHLRSWTEGGPTDLPNLVTLCWAHHRQVDLGRWDIHPKTPEHPGRPANPGTPANNGAPFTITLRPRNQWGTPHDRT